MFSVTGVALRPPVFITGQAMPVFLFMTFDTRNITRSFHRLMRFIVNGTMAVETGKIRPVSRVLETLYVNLKGALFAAFLVTTNTILGSVSLDFGHRGAPQYQRAAKEKPKWGWWRHPVCEDKTEGEKTKAYTNRQ